MDKGRFIVLEGLDRSGKSTICRFLYDKLNNSGRKACSIGFPNRNSITGKMINEFLIGKTEIGIEAVHLIFSANRWELIKDVTGKLEAGITVICDRYWYSGSAYSYAKGLDLNWCMAPDQGLPQPNLVILLKGDPVTLTQRQGYGQQRFEKLQFQQKVSTGFDLLIKKLKKDYIKIVETDGKSLEQLYVEISSLVDELN